MYVNLVIITDNLFLKGVNRKVQKNSSSSEFNRDPGEHVEHGLLKVLNRLRVTIERDALVKETIYHLQESLKVDRVVLYYFYDEWHGQVTCEALSSDVYSILGSTGPDECFNAEYAELYLAGRTRAITDIETEAITPCHRDFLRSLQVRANLVVPVLVPKGLWGLLVAHNCQSPRNWQESDFEAMQQSVNILATAPCILNS
jgi:GAF domain-containing protein